MKFIRPVVISTGTTLIDSSIPVVDTAGGDPAAWSGATAYTIGNSVSRGEKRWEAILASTNKDPLGVHSPPVWLERGPSNRQAMFDKSVGTLSKNASGSILIEVLPGSCDSVAVLDVDAYDVTLTIEVDGNEVFEATETVGDQAIINDWFDYFNEPIVPKTTLIFFDVPNYITGHYKLLIHSPTKPVAVGTTVFGKMFDLGLTQYGTSFGIVDYSKKTTNEYGVISVTERGFAKRINTKVEIDNYKIDDVDRALSSIRATPVVWIGAGNLYTSLITYGFYKDWSVEIAYATTSYCSLQIEGLT